MTSYQGSCHCGEITFRVISEIDELTTCNCSLCRLRNALMAKVTLDALEILSGENRLGLYEWNTRRAKHYFCKTCGIYLFHRKRAAPNHYGVNAFSLFGLDPDKLPHRATEGADMTIEDTGSNPRWPGPRP